MKKKVITLLFVLALLIAAAFPTFAGGGKVRGENGQGSVVQVQHENPPPFGD